MSPITEPLDSLVCSRICHDLAGAMGAVTNSFELMQLTGQVSPESEEFSLIDSSLTLMINRLQLFRLAFGPVATEQSININDLTQAVKAQFSQRVTLSMPGSGSITRATAKYLALGMMCLNRNLPNGGEVTLSENGAHWHLRVAGNVTPCPEWKILTDETYVPEKIEPNICEFLILSRCVRDGLCQVTLSSTQEALSVMIAA